MYRIRIIRALLLFALTLIGEMAYSQNKGKPIHFGNPKGSVFDIAFFEGGSALGVAEGTTINIYSVSNQKLLKKLEGGHTDVILSIDISSDSLFLVSAGRDSLIVLWNIRNQQVITKLNYHKGVVTSIKFSPDDKFILSGATDNQVKLYDLASNKVLFNMDGHLDDVLSVDFSRDGLYGASSSADKTIKIWSLSNGHQVKSINDLNAWQRNIFFTNDGRKLITCGDKSYVSFWDVSNMNSIRLLNTIKSGRNWLLSNDLHADKNTIATGGMEGVVRIKFSLGRYSYKVGKPITKVLFMPNEKSSLKVTVATLGKGVFMLDGKDMKLKN
jgi:WD40 repeat protein